MREKSPRLDPSVYRRRRLLVAGVAAGVIATPFLVSEVVDAVRHYDDPIPAGCTTYLAPGETRWQIATRIGEHVPGQDTGQIDFMIGRANPGVSAGEMQPGEIGIPEEYCDIVEQPGFSE